jgi:hypothetical protein
MSHRALIPALLASSVVAGAIVLAIPGSPDRPAALAALPAGAVEPAAVGLTLFFRNSQMNSLTMVGDSPRFLQGIDLLATASPCRVDEGIASLVHQGEFASLDWTGVKLADEDWRLDFDGVHFVRQRFHRNARWMDRPSQFLVVPTDDAGNPVGPVLQASAGRDDCLNAGDDGFVRRFLARQIARGCPAIGDTTGATFEAQGLVQWRDALHADQDARAIPLCATLVFKPRTANGAASAGPKAQTRGRIR